MTKIKVNQETVDYLQRLHYEVESREGGGYHSEDHRGPCP